MTSPPLADEETLIHSVAIQNAQTIFIARQQMEQQLVAAMELLEVERGHLAEAQELAKLGSWRLDLRTRATHAWSAQCYRILEISEDDNDGSYETFLDLVHPDDRGGMAAALADAINRRIPYVHDHRLLLPDGMLKWVQVRCAISYGEDDIPIRAAGTIQDITERKVAEGVLERSQQLLRIATSLGRIGGWDLDVPSCTVSMSDEVCAILGTPGRHHPRLEEAIDFAAPEFRETVRSAIAACISDATSFDVEIQIINRQNDHVWVRVIGEAQVDGSGVVTGVRGAFQNISDRVHAIEALRVSDERFRLVAEAASDAVWDWNLVTDGCWWSDGLRTRLGHAPGASTSVAFWSDNIHPDDRTRVLNGIHAHIESGRPWCDQYRFRKGDGTYADISDRGHVALHPDGRPYRMLGAMVDITQQRLVEAQVEQIQRVASLGQLASNMAHEFNNVLMGIQPFVEVIRRVTLEIPKAQDATDRILRSVKRGRDITGEILRFTRHVDPIVRSMDVREWLADFSSQVPVGHALKLEVTLPIEPLRIQGDQAQLDQVLSSLLINAREAAAEGARVVISAGPCRSRTAGMDPSSFVELTVRDFGSGMDSSTLLHIFDPLFTTKQSGTGLGLAIVHQIISKHGGTITVESELGKGTAFHILLPASPNETDLVVASDPRRKRLPAMVLIVDDETAVAEGIAMLLASEGLRSASVWEGVGTLAAIERHCPELVLLDIGLPDISGVEVFRQIHDRWPDLPVILMTGHYSRSELTSILELPRVGFLQKPFGVDELLAAVEL